MVKMKQIRLVNFGGYEDSTFDFTKGTPELVDGYVPPSLRATANEVVPISLFYGPNGIGKSTILEAVRFVANPKVFYGRQQAPDVYLRPWVRDTEYQPISDMVLKKPKARMRVEAVFTDGVKDYDVHLSGLGFEKMELPDRPEGSPSGGYLFYVDADHAMAWTKFQLNSTYAQRFIELAEAIYGYPCDLDGDVKDQHVDEETGDIVERQTYYQDLIITKGKTKVHFKSMSAGEKKIATMIRQLCNPDATDDRDIILIDNWEMHVYFKRHAKMIEKLKEYFSGKQIIATTHSQSMIEYGAKASYVKNFDLELFKPEYKMFDAVDVSPVVEKSVEIVLEPLTEEPEPETTETEIVMNEEALNRQQEARNFSIADETLRNLKEKLAASPVTDPDALPEGHVRRTIQTPFGEMTVIVPSSSDKAGIVDGVDKLQSMVDNAVKIDVDEMGKIVSYHDPLASKYTPGSGQIKRVKSQLSPGQRRRQEAGEAIITDPVVLAPSVSDTKSLSDFEGDRTAAIKDSIEANTKTIADLGRGGCCTGGFCGTPQPGQSFSPEIEAQLSAPSLSSAHPDVIPTLNPGEGEGQIGSESGVDYVTTENVEGIQVRTLPAVEVVEYKDEKEFVKANTVINVQSPQADEKPKGFWASVLGFIKGE